VIGDARRVANCGWSGSALVKDWVITVCEPVMFWHGTVDFLGAANSSAIRVFHPAVSTLTNSL